MTRILEVEKQKTINCSKSTILWNYWDHEHLTHVHNGYDSSDILYETEKNLFRIDNLSIPLLFFIKFKTPIFMCQHDSNTIITYAFHFGVLSKTKITIKSLSKTRTKIIMNYKFELNGWRKILYPLLKIMIPKWNDQVWLEDLPLKKRREMVKNFGFKDFYGLPRNIKDRKKLKNNEFILPIVRPKKSIRDEHPFKE